MKIAEVNVYWGRPRWGFVEIVTDDGLTGWGEAIIEGKANTVLACVEEMKEYPIVEAEPFPFYQNWIYQDWIYQEKEVDSLTDQRGFRFRIGAVSNDYYTKLSMIEQGFGFGIFPKICIESALRFAPDLRVFAIEDHPAHRKLLVARKETMQMTAAARSFWEFLIEYHHLPADE